MNNPFSYPRSIHKRQFAPPHSNDYRKYKPTLRLEYERKCVYCKFPDTMKEGDAFGVDHYRPKSIFPLLETEYSNLFYCCNTCNRRKGNKWLTSPLPFIPNPDDHVMFDHLRFKQDIVEPITDAGKYTCELLQLNHPVTTRIRRTLLTSLTALENDLEALAKLDKAIRKQFNKGNITMAERDADLAEVEIQRLETQAAVDAIAGRP